MKKLSILAACISTFALIVSTGVAPVYASSTVSDSSIQPCYNASGSYMGAASMRCTFNYTDGSYVEENRVMTYYKEQLESRCAFDNIKSGHLSSGTYAYGQCYYYAYDDEYYNYGLLMVTCNEYGETSDEGYTIERGYIDE